MHSPPAAPQRSTFVSVVAIIFIALSAMSLISTIMQYVFHQISALTPGLEPGSELWETMPKLHRMMFTHMGWIALYGVVINSTWLAASIGMLLRKNWGRVTFICLMLFNLLVMLVMAVLVPISMQQMIESMGPGELPPEAQNMLFIIPIVIALGIVTIFGVISAWIVWKLTRPAIRAEFV